MQSIERLPLRRGEEIPFRREPLIEGNAFLRLITAQVRSELSGVPVNKIIERSWPNDRTLDMVVRATSAPAMTSVVGWAAELAHKLVYDSLDALAPMSAGAQLLRNGTVLTMGNAAIITLPGFVASAANAGFVAEGQPIPVRQLSSAGPQLLPYKLASITALTQELIESSNAEQLIGNALMSSAGIALDAALFDANPATAARPAGLRNGIGALTASNNSDMIEAAFEDFATMINSAAAVGGPGPYVLIAAPGRAMSIRSRISAYRSDIQQTLIGDVLGSPAMGGDLMVVGAAAIVSAFDPNPDIEAANAATIVMDDTAPSTPDTTQPTKSMFQTASVAVKMRWPMSWALRDPRGVAWLTPAWK